MKNPIALKRMHWMIHWMVYMHPTHSDRLEGPLKLFTSNINSSPYKWRHRKRKEDLVILITAYLRKYNLCSDFKKRLILAFYVYLQRLIFIPQSKKSLLIHSLVFVHKLFLVCGLDYSWLRIVAWNSSLLLKWNVTYLP